ncbi:MAG: hypothetical protein RLZZ308_690 [Candidatus Parcubacteria bacterium]|jgi:hypothetical protein
MKTLKSSIVLCVLGVSSTLAHAEGFRLPDNYTLFSKNNSIKHTKDVHLVQNHDETVGSRITTTFRQVDSFTLTLNEHTFCKEVALNFFGNASHPGGNRGGALNERNDGYGFTCYKDKNRDSFLFLNALVNSQYGNSLAFGFAEGVKIIEWQKIRFDAGISITFLSYEKRNNDVVYGILPIPYIKLSYTLPRDLGRISIAQHYLGKGITLRNMEAVSIHLEKLF